MHAATYPNNVSLNFNRLIHAFFFHLKFDKNNVRPCLFEPKQRFYEQNFAIKINRAKSVLPGF